MPLISISDQQRIPMPPVNWVSTIHHGMPRRQYKFHRKRGTYLAFVGRIAPEKRPDRAIEIARRSGIPLKIAAKVDAVDQAYFASEIEPRLNDPLVNFVGEIDDHQKETFLGEALALLFPIDWCEPFGLVMIEAMAVGTPVIAWRNGSVPEVIESGRTGAIVDSIDQAVEAIQDMRHLDRGAIRRCFESRFTSSRMAQDYLFAYQQIICNGQNEVTVELGDVSVDSSSPLQSVPVERSRLTLA
jgi:glycosyltransferase involved in cell wall biosynthesis